MPIPVRWASAESEGSSTAVARSTQNAIAFCRSAERLASGIPERTRRSPATPSETLSEAIRRRALHVAARGLTPGLRLRLSQRTGLTVEELLHPPEGEGR